MKWLDKIHANAVHTRRVRVLAESIARLLPTKVRTVADIGCGDGLLAAYLSKLRPELIITGVDILARPASSIPVIIYNGHTIPAPDETFDATLLIDVCHHTASPEATLRETLRITSRCIILKDHNLTGFLAGPTLRFMDKVGNEKHGVALPNNYLDKGGWRKAFLINGIHVKAIETLPDLYPTPASWVFGRSLHFITRLERIN